MANLYINTGMIGSGKSTWAKQYAKENPRIRIVNDDSLMTMFHGYYLYDIDFQCDLKSIISMVIRKLLLLGYDVIYDDCNLTKEERKTIINSSLRTDKVFAVVFQIKDKQWHLNNRSKNLRGYSIEEWSDVFDKHLEIYEPVEYDEGFDDIIRIGDMI